MDRIEAWRYVMQWAKNEIEFIPLTQKLAEIGNYKHEDWKPLFDQLFTHSEEDDVLGATATVETAMRARGLSFPTDPSVDVITNQNALPCKLYQTYSVLTHMTISGPSKGSKRRCRKTRPASDDLPFPKRRKVSCTLLSLCLTDRLVGP